MTFASIANGGVVIELVPDQPGPYLGGESLTVDVWLQSEETFDVWLRMVQFYFTDTDPAIGLDDTFAFDFGAISNDTGQYAAFLFPELPVPWTINLAKGGPSSFLPLLAGGMLHIGSIGVQLPREMGVYRLDLLNPQEEDISGGALIELAFTDPTEVVWRAFTGEITGVTDGFRVIPEASSLAFLAFGALTIMRRRRGEGENISTGKETARLGHPTRRFLLKEFDMSRCKVVLCVMALASIADAGVIVELIPDQAGPYLGGESLTVDVWLQSEEPVEIGLRRVQFDFSDTDPALALDPTLTFDFWAIPSDINGYLSSTFPDLPVPSTFMSLDCFCPGFLLQLPAEGLGSLHVGSIGVMLATDPGLYLLDALNPNDPDETIGGQIRIGFTSGPTGLWRAYSGEITGGTFEFLVIPEPTTLALLALGAGCPILCTLRAKGGGRMHRLRAEAT